MSVLTLLDGVLTLERPRPMTLAPGQEVTADAGARATRVRSLSPAELQQRIAWRFRFQFRGWCTTPGEPFRQRSVSAPGTSVGATRCGTAAGIWVQPDGAIHTDGSTVSAIPADRRNPTPR